MDENIMGVNPTENVDVNVASSQEPEQVTENVQSQPNEQVPMQGDNQRVEQAFAARLAQEKQKLEQQYSPYKSIIEQAAKESGMSVDQYLNAIEQQRQQQERQRYIDQGINPDVINELLEKHPDIQYAREMKAKEMQQAKFNSEAQELFTEFPELEPKDIPQEVFQLKEQKGLSLLDAYLRINYKQMKVKTEQEVINKLSNNAASTPGALGAEGVEHNKSISKMPKKEFDTMLQQVLRGERTEI